MAEQRTDISLENAEEIIERFGGIRPMANKMRVPVTTVQGWKKRNVIPAGRKDEILNAAAQNNIDLSDIPDFTANENDKEVRSEKTAGYDPSVRSSDPVSDVREERVFEVPPESRVRHGQDASGLGPQGTKESSDYIMARMRGVEKKALRQSAWVAGVLVVVAIAVGAFIMWPTAQKVDSHGRRIDALEKDVVKLDGDLGSLVEKQSLLSRVIPEDFDLEKLQEQAGNLQKMVGAIVDTADQASKVVADPAAGGLPERVKRLEAQMQALAGTPQFTELLARVDEFKQTVSGQQTLDNSVSQLNTLVQGLQGRMDQFDEAMVAARGESEELDRTFEGVSNQDLKAAAMLIGMSKLRDSLNRGEKPFGDDLQLLLNLVGEDNPELRSSLEKLAPHAEEGVLTTEGLSNEFRSLAGDIVVASLSGEDVSIQEKAKARMNEIFQVEKDGELLTGTDTQATVARADNMLASGNLAGALTELQSLQGGAALAATPFMEKAQAALQAQEAKTVISNFIRSHVSAGGGSGAKYTTKMKGFSSFVPSGRVIHDEESGVSVLQHAPSLPR